MPAELKEMDGGRFLEVRATGKLTAGDYQNLVPEFERLTRRNGPLRVLFALHDFHGWTPGGLWEDVKFDTRHFSDIERLAIAGESKWQAGMATVCKLFTTAQIRYFTTEQMEAAREWLRSQTGDSAERHRLNRPVEAPRNQEPTPARATNELERFPHRARVKIRPLHSLEACSPVYYAGGPMPRH